MKPAKSQKIKSTISFSAKLSMPKATEKVAWLLLPVPKSVSTKLPSQDVVAVEGTLKGLPFRSDIVVDSKEGYALKVSKALCDVVKVKEGDEVTVEILRVGDEPEVRMPVDLDKALAATPKAKELWEKITPIARRDWIFWISTAKQQETQQGRIEKACSKLSSGMRRVCCFPGLNWMMKQYEPAKEKTVRNSNKKKSN